MYKIVKYFLELRIVNIKYVLVLVPTTKKCRKPFLVIKVLLEKVITPKEAASPRGGCLLKVLIGLYNDF